MVSFQIKSLQHPIVKHCVLLRKDAHYRKEHQRVLIIGKKQLLELPKDLKIFKLFSLEKSLLLKNAQAHYLVSEEILQKISGMPSPEPYIAEVEIPHVSIKKLERLLVCDGIADPGNLGTLLRTAVSFGFDAVYLLPNSVDPYHEKVIRAAQGALFHLPILVGDWQHLLEMQTSFSLKLYQADTEGVPLDQCTIHPPFALILGSEAHGTSQTTKNYAKAIAIPMTKNIESLNVAVAGGILMFNTSSLCQR